MNKTKGFVAMAMCGMMVLPSIAGCGGGGAPADFTKIQVCMPTTEFTSQYYTELVNTYNQTQGQQDKVFARFMPGGANLSASLSTTLGGRSSDSQVLGVTDQYFKNYAVQNYFVSIEDLLKDESLRTKDESGNPILDFDEIPDGLVDRYRLDTATRRAGAGTNLYGIPNGDNPEVFFYNPNHLQQANMKIISVEEGDLAAYNAAHNTSYVAHGYAEYLQNPAPGENLVSSKNRAGDTVYKVFNEAIPMNWEEMVEFSKYFTPEYDTADCKAPAGVKYGFLSEWWFFMAWSVGGDCVGFNPEIGKYEFTLADSNANYLVTKNSVTVNGSSYNAGDTLKFLDKKYVAEHTGDAAISNYLADGTLYAIDSTYDAFKEFCALAMPTSKNVTTADPERPGSVTTPGYGISPNPSLFKDSSYAAYFTSGQVTMIAQEYSAANNVKTTNFSSFSACANPQYREYEGGSLDQNGNLKVIGKDGYTGQLKKVNEAEVVGNYTTGSISTAFVIPKNSGGEKEYQAAWKFIQWAASLEGQKILAKGNSKIPNQTAYAMSDEFTQRADKKFNNQLVASKLAQVSREGDWAYLEDGEWVKVWSGDLNDKVRNGLMDLDVFIETALTPTNNALKADKYKIVITTK